MPLPTREELETRYGQMVAEQRAREAAAAQQISQGVGGATRGLGLGLMDQVRYFRDLAQKGGQIAGNYINDIAMMRDPTRNLPGYTELSAMGEAALNPQTYIDYGRDVYRQATESPESLGRLIGQNINPFRLPKGVGPRKIFIGERAGNWDLGMQNLAEALEKGGHDPESIWQKTGTFRGPDGKWRQEISDQLSAFDIEKLPENYNALDWADQWLKDHNYVTKPGITIQSPSIPEDVRKQALDFGRKMAATATRSTDLETALTHPELQSAYPRMYYRMSVAKEQSPYFGGRFDEKNELVTTGGGEVINAMPGSSKYNPHSTLLHELQHAVQAQENFARGGTPESARYYLSNKKQQELAPFAEAMSQRVNASNSVKSAYQADYAHHLREMQTKENIKPRQLLNMQDWYQYHSEVTDELGKMGLGWKMPTKPGAQRDRWINAAVKSMQKFIERDRPEMVGAADRMTREEAKRQIAKANRIFTKTQDQAIQQSKVSENLRRLEEMPDYELYRRLAGEAEARAVQQRMNMTPEQRRATFPLREIAKGGSYDVPISELIISR